MSEIKETPFTGKIRIMGKELDCAVIRETDREPVRLLSETTVTRLIGGKRSTLYDMQKALKTTGRRMPIYLPAAKLESFVDGDLRDKLENPILYRRPGQRGINPAHGVKAEVLADICDVWLKARDAGVLEGKEIRIAKTAEALMRALARTAIAALIDEATGYQDVRDRLALQRILEAYISKELMAWQKRFPDEFYEMIFKLNNWQWKGRSTNPPQIVGKYTKNIVYERLAPGVIQELERLNPPDAKGRRPNKHHQWLTVDVGHPKLNEHLASVMALMRASSNWMQFKRNLVRAFPKPGDQMELSESN